MADPTTKPPAQDEVTVLLSGLEYRFWNDIELHMALDNHASVGFTVPFEPEEKSFRDTFRPFSFLPTEVQIGGNTVFTGTLIDVNPRVTPKARYCDISAYSKPGVLADSDLPASANPSQMTGLNLHQIAQQLCKPFAIDVIAQDVHGAVFKKVKIGHGTKVQGFLQDLAQQRGSVLSSTNLGQLRIWRSVEPGHPVANLQEGDPGITNLVATFSPQEYFSEITGYAGARRARKGATWTERNTRLAGGVLRASSFTLDDTEKADAPAAVKAKLGRMFGNVVSYVFDVPSWNDPMGRRWQPNTTVTLTYPSAMIYQRTEFLVRDVFLRQDARSQTASIGLVLPGSFSGEVPSRMPWDE